MIPDIPSYFEAIFWYVAMKMSYPKYLKGQLNQNIYYDMRNSWNFYRRQAYAEAMMPTVDELETIKNVWHKPYTEMRIMIHSLRVQEMNKYFIIGIDND